MAAFRLVGGQGAAPEEILGKSGYRHWLPLVMSDDMNSQAGGRLARHGRVGPGWRLGACSCTGMSSKPITRVSTKESTTGERHHGEHPGDAHRVGRIEDCTLVKSPGAAMEWLASPAMPAAAPQ